MEKSKPRIYRWIAGTFLMLFCVLAVSMTTRAAVANVGGLKQTEHSETSIGLKWNAVSGADGYNIYLATSKTGTYKKQFKYNGTECEVSDLKAGQHYFAKVTAVIGKQESDLAAAAAVDVTTAPKYKITDLKVRKLNDTSISLSWECDQADYFVVSGKASLDDDPIGFTKTGTAEEKITISKLTPRAEYTLTITPAMKGSYTATADDDYAASITFHTLPKTPAAPKVKEPKAGSNGPVKVTLKMPGGISGAVYELYECADKETSETPVTKTDKASYTLKVTEPGSFYSVRYKYYTTVNGKNWYTEWSPKTYVAVAPASLTLKRSSKKINASWKKVAGATSYTVCISTSKKASTFKVAGTTKKLKLTIKKFGSKALNKKKKYYIKVIANKKVDKKTFTSAAQLGRK